MTKTDHSRQFIMIHLRLKMSKQISKSDKERWPDSQGSQEETTGKHGSKAHCHRMHSSHKFASESSLSSIATATGKRLDQATSKPHFQDGMTQPRGTTCYHIWVKVKRYPRKPPRIPTLSVSFIRSWPAGDATVPPCPKPPTDGHFLLWKTLSCRSLFQQQEIKASLT